jgi:hypothetical protein
MMIRQAEILSKWVFRCTYLVFSFALCFSDEFPHPVSSPTSLSESTSHQQREWPEHEVEGISYQVALSSVRGGLGKPGSHQTMLIFLDQDVFNEDRVLKVFGHISKQVPPQTTLFVTILTDRKLLRDRLQNPRWESMHDNEYSRLTDQPQNCCPAAFKGAQIERYSDMTLILVCDLGRTKKLCVGERCRP